MSLELAMVGNCRVGALVDTAARVVWMCVPGFDGEPVFCSLLDPVGGAGEFAVELEGCEGVEQAYLPNSAVLRTLLRGPGGGLVEVVDFAPRLHRHGRVIAPVSLVRIVRRLAGRVRVRVRLRPAAGRGAQAAALRAGSSHVAVDLPAYPLRLTTDAPVTRVLDGEWFGLASAVTLVLGPDETLDDAPGETGRALLEGTLAYWRRWVRGLAVPFEWQDAVIRAAITLKLNAYDDTGAIAAALTTSIPEAPGTQRNWDYRFCWLRDAYFVVGALNRLGATASMRRYLEWLQGLIDAHPDGRLQPVYTLAGGARLDERVEPALRGYLGQGPVRTGNDAWRQRQNDVYGAAILGVAHAFFDRRLDAAGDAGLFGRLERAGEHAWASHDTPDAGIWEFRGRAEVHTLSAVMCWAACDRLAHIARHLGLEDRARLWTRRARRVHDTVCARGWSQARGAFTATYGGRDLDASLLLLTQLRFLPNDDPRLRSTVHAIADELARGDFVLRYARPDDFGAPGTAFVVCAFWLIRALAAIGERERARAMFERVLGWRNRFGLLSEDIDPATGRLWGNFPQTYSMVGIVDCAIDLSVRWEDAI